MPMSTYEYRCCCTYDLHHSPPWLLLLSFIFDRLIYHAVLLLCPTVAITQLMFSYEHVLEFFQLHLTSFIFSLPFAFFQLGVGSQSTNMSKYHSTISAV